jgi:hypothetical protein
MPAKKRFVEVLRDVFNELGAIDDISVHYDEFAPIVARRWKELGHQTRNIDAQIRDKLQDYWPDSAAWKERAARGRKWPDWFINHGEGRWSMRSGTRITDELLV